MKSVRWLLPDGIEELLPEDAERIEVLRDRLLSLYRSWGYRLVVPPLVEFLESLLTGVGQDLELQTFKLTDQFTGRMMGVRADMTPQVARIDARFHPEGVANRLCYIGTVLRTRPGSQLSSRSPLQSGCELYGVDGIEADIEIISLMLDALRAASVAPLHLDLSHVAIARRLLDRSGLDEEGRRQLSDAWRRKAIPEVDQLAAAVREPAVADLIRALPRTMVGLDGIEAVRQRFAGDQEVLASLEQLQRVATVLASRFPDIEICFDLCEMRGYHYHTGLFFAAYTQGHGQAIAEGGRYDGAGRDFGDHRAATGFSIDLRALLKRSAPVPSGESRAILAPDRSDAGLWSMVASLREAGEVVLFEMPGDTPDALRARCDRRLVKAAGDEVWRVEVWA